MAKSNVIQICIFHVVQNYIRPHIEWSHQRGVRDGLDDSHCYRTSMRLSVKWKWCRIRNQRGVKLSGPERSSEKKKTILRRSNLRPLLQRSIIHIRDITAANFDTKIDFGSENIYSKNNDRHSHHLICHLWLLYSTTRISVWPHEVFPVSHNTIQITTQSLNCSALWISFGEALNIYPFFRFSPSVLTDFADEAQTNPDRMSVNRAAAIHMNVLFIVTFFAYELNFDVQHSFVRYSLLHVFI